MSRIRIDMHPTSEYISCFFKNECWEMRDIGRGAQLVSERLRLASTGSCACAHPSSASRPTMSTAKLALQSFIYKSQVVSLYRKFIREVSGLPQQQRGRCMHGPFHFCPENTEWWMMIDEEFRRRSRGPAGGAARV